MVSGLAADSSSNVVVAAALALAEIGVVAALAKAIIAGFAISSYTETITGTLLRRMRAEACSSGTSQANTMACTGIHLLRRLY